MAKPTYVWTGSEWAEVGPGPVVPTTKYQATAPESPSTGDIWVDSSSYAPGVEAQDIAAGHRILTTAQRDALGSVTTGTTIFNSTEKRVEVYTGTTWLATDVGTNCIATPTYSGGGSSSSFVDEGKSFSVFTFTGSGTLNVTQRGFADVLIIGGGASGGSAISGGGGAGGVYEGSMYLPVGSYTVTVGAGGAATAFDGIGNAGAESSFNNIFVPGGGSSQPYNQPGFPGGCGGGGSRSFSASGLIYAGGGGSKYGHPGGRGSNTGAQDNYGSGGGGGGGGGVGGDASGGTAGNGGKGYTTRIRGSVETFAGGGGGSSYNGTGGTGGTGGGGNGGGNGAGTAGSAFGAGGGACGYPNTRIGSAGAAGVVIIRVNT